MEPISFPISIHTTPRPPTDADITQHSSIRLDALRTNPESFFSTYARESKFDHAKWRERLEQEGAWTFYAKCDNANEFDESRHGLNPEPMTRMPRARLCGSAHTRSLGLSSWADSHMFATPLKQWLATLTLLSPPFLNSLLNNSPIMAGNVTVVPPWPLSLLGPETDLWLIVGLWVRPEWRRKGVGHKIVQRAVRFVINSLRDSRPDGDHSDLYQSHLGTSNSKTTLVLLQVYARNTSAVKLYESVGFEVLSDPNQEAAPESAQLQAMGIIQNGNHPGGECDETHWMGYTIPPFLPHRSNL